MTKKRRVNRGRRPSKTVIAEMKQKGYVLPGAAAKLAKVAASTVYGWIERKAVAVVRSESGNLWISLAAVEDMIKRAHPAAALPVEKAS